MEILEAAMEGELDEHLKESKEQETNRRNTLNSFHHQFAPNISIEAPNIMSNSFKYSTWARLENSTSSLILKL